jgi:vacuolar-type H+-ATPase subunit E/Vma4
MNLEPLRRALRAEAETDTASRRAEVAARCDRIITAAEAEARRLTTQGRTEGERAAEHEAVRRRAAATRRAREIRLEAQRRQVEELRRRARAEALALRADDRYPALLDRLSRAAQEQLGDEADVVVDPPELGGVIGRRGNASVDYTLPAIADRIVDDLGPELEELWR